MAIASPALNFQPPLPPTSETTPGSGPVQLPDMTRAEKDRMARLHKARKAYAGDWSGDMPLKMEKDEPDDNVLVNRCGPIVDKDVSWLAKDGLRMQVMEPNGTSTAPQAASDFLMAALGCSQDNFDQLLVLFTNIVQAGAVSGHPFVKLIPGKNGILPRAIVLDNANVWVDPDPEDYNLALAYNIQYDWLNPKDHRLYQKRQCMVRIDPDDDSGDLDEYSSDTTWEITTYIREKPAMQLTLENQREDGWTQLGKPEEWPHSWPPIHDCKNLPSECNYYGTPSITPDLIHLNVVINRLLSYCSKISRIYGHPWVWTAGVDAKEVISTPGRIICLPGEEHKLAVAEAKGDLANMMALVQSLMISMDEQSRTPAVALGRMTEIPRGLTSSSPALKLLFEPRMEKTEHMRRLYGGLLATLCEHILELGNFKGLHVKIDWPSLLPEDDLQMAQMALTLQQLGVPMQMIYPMVGLDYDTAQEFLKEEAADKAKNIAAGLANPTTPTGLPSVADAGNPQPVQQNAANAGAGGNLPPVNHPAFLQQQAKVAAMSKKPNLNG